MSPAGHTLDEANETYSLRLINDESTPMNASLSIEGDLAPYLTVEPNELILPPGESRATVGALLPGLEPGLHQGRIRVSASSGGGQFGSVVTLTHVVSWYESYPGVYLEPELTARGTELKLAIHNRGDVAGNDSALLTILDEEVVEEVDFGLVHVPERASSFLVHDWEPPVAPGFYTAIARLTDAERQDTLEFTVGSPTATIGQLPAELPAESIERIVVPVTIAWNRPVAFDVDVQLGAEHERSPRVEGLRADVPVFVSTGAARNETLTIRVLAPNGIELGRISKEITIIPVRQDGPKESPIIITLLILLTIGMIAMILLLHNKRHS